MSAESSTETARGTTGRRLGALAVGLAVILVALGTFRALKHQAPPSLQPNLPHRAALGGRRASVCLGCHVRGSEIDRPKNHTGRQDCWSCHALGASAVSQESAWVLGAPRRP